MSPALVELAGTLAVRCADLVDIDAAGLLLADGAQRLRLAGSSSERVDLLELFQLQHLEGPCLDCFQSGAPVTEEDLGDTDRWPRFRVRSVAAGFQAVQAIPMRRRGEVLGALDLFRTRPGRFDERDVSVCRAMVDLAAIGLLQERAAREARNLNEHLHTALDSRLLIEQAKGVVSARASIDMETAFGLLRGYARHHQRLLTDVARDLIEARLDARQL